MTGKAVQSKVLIPNIALKNVIEEFLERVPSYSKVVLEKKEEKIDVREIKKEEMEVEMETMKKFRERMKQWELGFENCKHLLVEMNHMSRGKLYG